MCPAPDISKSDGTSQPSCIEGCDLVMHGIGILLSQDGCARQKEVRVRWARFALCDFEETGLAASDVPRAAAASSLPSQSPRDDLSENQPTQKRVLLTGRSSAGCRGGCVRSSSVSLPHFASGELFKRNRELQAESPDKTAYTAANGNATFSTVQIRVEIVQLLQAGTWKNFCCWGKRCLESLAAPQGLTLFANSLASQPREGVVPLPQVPCGSSVPVRFCFLAPGHCLVRCPDLL